MKERDRYILEHVVGYCDDIKEIITEYDETLDTLRIRKAFRHSVAMCVFQIGELTHHLTTEFRDTHTLIPWKKIRGMRNKAAHHYERFNVKVLHETIMNDVPTLRVYCQKLLDEDDNKPETKNHKTT